MEERDALVCADCGVEMNRHAEKVRYDDGEAAAEGFDAELGGVVEEYHSCPECGHTSARPAP